MTYDRPPGQVPATPKFILAEIRDSHRQQCEFDPEAEPSADLTFESTIAEWREACDLIGWKGLGRALDEYWKLGQTDEAWRSVLEPARQRTLRDLCEFVAAGAVRPTIAPLKILGAKCLPAGAFLAIRSLLRDAGVDTEPITPSTPYDDYARRHLGVFLGPISRLAPGALPAVKVRTPWYDLCLYGFVLGMAAAFIGHFSSPLVTIAGVVLAATFCFGTLITCRLKPSVAAFGDLRTFGDMARVIAAHNAAHPFQ